MIQSGHIVAIFGGAVAGSEAAKKLTERGIRCVVFEQSSLPYGKLESGLPKWHVKLRNQNESRIDEKLKHPLVEFVPFVKLGQKIKFPDLINHWGFSAVLLATGAWRDRSLPVPGINHYINKGFYYQNPFVAWFNKNHDPDYYDPDYRITDNALIIGGGLASIDVAKIVMIETVKKALENKGHKIDVHKIEKKGIPDLLAELGLSFANLGLNGCTLYYRRRLIDMPLNSFPGNPSEEDIEKTYNLRKRIMENVQRKFLFRFEDCHQPVDKIVENNRLVGLVFKKTKVEHGKLVSIEGSEYKVRGPLVLSAIGSLPEKIPGIPYTGSTYDIEDANTGQLVGFDNVFALGNAVTGRGNIRESQLHGRCVSEQVMDEYLVWQAEDYEEIFKKAVANADKKVEAIGEHLYQRQVLAPEKIIAILDRVRELQNEVGYRRDYDAWIEKFLPKRLEILNSS
jgi:ferredoxin--NADP+ reductase